VMDGCLDEQNTAHALRDGWYYTGTEGRLEDGRLSLE
jgi:long-subunit acyl-CoA synthetase (AMP-forming)